MSGGYRIDSAVPLSLVLIQRYTRHVAHQLGSMPLQTRVVTYGSYTDEIPDCYDCETARCHDELRLWIKNREYDPTLEALRLRPSRSYRAAAG